jgi:ankyrin repeat protein
VQLPLIDLLCDHGADPNSALQAAAAHGEFAAVEALLGRGAQLTLSIAAALNRIDEFRRMLPDASSEERHLALAFASQFGHVEIVRSLLDAGEDPNRYNPSGSHSHSTPLHQAAFAGHDALVQLLLERRARTDFRDTLWQGTAADWAEYAGRTETAAYLLAHGTKQGEA